MDSDAGFQYLHPATAMEALLEAACHNNYFKTVYTLTLCSKMPIPAEVVKKALTHLFRKVATLRFCFRRREGQLWACYMNREELDFQVVEGEEAHKVTEDLGSYDYNVTDGPLWCARLLINDGTLKHSRAELEAEFPHTCTLALANHHSNADGTTNSQTVNFFLQILNDIFAGRDVDDNVPMGEYTGHEEIDQLLNIQDEKLEQDPENLKALLQRILEDYLDEPQSNLLFQPIDGVPFKTMYVETALDFDTSQRFIKKCKSNGITVNSGMMALLNVTLVDSLHEAGVVIKEYLKSCTSVSMRRYLPKDMSDILGVHTSLLIKNLTAPATAWKNSFWEYAKNVHAEMYQGLKVDPITYHCLGRRLFYHTDSYRKGFSKPHAPEWDYIAATMGNLDTRIPTEGEHVRIGHIVRFCTNGFEPFMHMYHSFRGRFYYSISYSENLVTKEQTQLLMENLITNLKSQV